MSEPATGRDARPRVNRWEIALWVIGVVLIVVSLVVEVPTVGYLYGGSNGEQPTWFQAFRPAIETALQLDPGVLTAGLMSIILAIVVRALRVNVKRPAIAAAPAPVVEMIEIVQPSPVPSREPAQTDHSMFMRPSEDRAKQGG
jgi:hypothetical protein